MKLIIYIVSAGLLFSALMLLQGCESGQIELDKPRPIAADVEVKPVTPVEKTAHDASKTVSDAVGKVAQAVTETAEKAIDTGVDVTVGTTKAMIDVGQRAVETVADETAVKTVSESVKPKYEPMWESLNKRPTPRWFTDAKFGIFICWGLYSVPSWAPQGQYAEWYGARVFDKKGTLQNNEWGQFHLTTFGPDKKYEDFVSDFRCEMFDPEEWAGFIERSGAKYVVLTAKYHDGYALWQSREANRAWGRPWNSVDTGPKRDLLGDLTESVRAQGIKMGIYYSLYEWFNPLWLEESKRDIYVSEHLFPQFRDVVEKYRPSIIFADGEWEMNSDKWRSEELLAWLFNESACRENVVVNDRWGKDCRHKNGGYYTTEYGAGLPDDSHPWEENRGMGFSYGLNRNEDISQYKSTRELILILCDLVSRGGNLLLDIGPTSDGRIPVIMQERMAQIGDWLKVNGEAIYGTSTWRKSCQWSEGKKIGQEYKNYKAKYDVLETVGLKPVRGRAVKQIFFTSKENAVYAILPAWPGNQIIINDVNPPRGFIVKLLGREGALPWKSRDNNMIIDLSGIKVDEIPCKHAWVLKISDKI